MGSIKLLMYRFVAHPLVSIALPSTIIIAGWVFIAPRTYRTFGAIQVPARAHLFQGCPVSNGMRVLKNRQIIPHFLHSPAKQPNNGSLLVAAPGLTFQNGSTLVRTGTSAQIESRADRWQY